MVKIISFVAAVSCFILGLTVFNLTDQTARVHSLEAKNKVLEWNNTVLRRRADEAVRTCPERREAVTITGNTVISGGVTFGGNVRINEDAPSTTTTSGALVLKNVDVVTTSNRLDGTVVYDNTLYPVTNYTNYTVERRK